MLIKDNSLDVLVGLRIQERRKLLSITAVGFAKALNVSYQQLYKYETGQNRVSATTLKDISHILGVSVEYFFDSRPEREEDSKVDLYKMPVRNHNPSQLIDDPETKKLIKSFVQIDDFRMRNAVIEVASSISCFIRKKSKNE